jgi:hypothetical protein
MVPSVRLRPQAKEHPAESGIAAPRLTMDSKSQTYLSEARAAEQQADKASDAEARAIFRSFADQWRKLAELRLRLIRSR